MHTRTHTTAGALAHRQTGTHRYSGQSNADDDVSKIQKDARSETRDLSVNNEKYKKIKIKQMEKGRVEKTTGEIPS